MAEKAKNANAVFKEGSNYPRCDRCKTWMSANQEKCPKCGSMQITWQTYVKPVVAA